MRILLAMSLLMLPLHGGEIATGRMLGQGFDARSFYVRDKPGETWRKTYSGPAYRAEAAGRLMNLRIAQAIVHDEWLVEEKFDPEKNTDRVIAALDGYKRHGILEISTSLQGGNPAYELTQNIKRQRAYSLGPDKGMLMSAFRPDGSLKSDWMGRVLRLVRALDQRGMYLHLIYFYQHQDEVLRDPAAIRQAAINATDWLIANNARNVIIEVANEIDAGTYDHDRYIRRNLGDLIQLIRSRFAERKAGFKLPISTSTTGGGSKMEVPPEIVIHGDFILLHGNNLTPERKRQRTAELSTDPRAPMPIVFSEDNNGRETDAATLAKELASVDGIFQEGGSWGYMPWRPAQIFPFRIYDPFQATGQDAEYFRKVLEHMSALVFVNPPKAAK